MTRFRACVVHQRDGQVSAALENIRLDDLGQGDVVIEAHYSSVNYKDALAATGRGRIIKHFPLVAGVDVAGVVVSSASPRFSAGDPVISAWYGAEGATWEAFGLVGIDVPLAPGWSLFAEGRYRSATAELGDDFSGSPRTTPNGP